MYATFDDDVQYSEKALVKSAFLILSHFKNTHLHQWTMVKTFVDLLSVTMLSLLNAMKLKPSLDHRKSFKFVYNGKAKRRATDGQRNPITTAHSTRHFHAISSYILGPKLLMLKPV